MNNEYSSGTGVNTDKLNFFTKTAYKLMTSKRKYLNIFFLLASFSISLSCFTEFAILFSKAFSHAVKLNIALANNIELISFEHVRFVWGVAWGEFVLAAIFLTILTFSILVGIKMFKIYFTFQKLGIALEPYTL